MLGQTLPAMERCCWSKSCDRLKIEAAWAEFHLRAQQVQAPPCPDPVEMQIRQGVSSNREPWVWQRNPIRPADVWFRMQGPRLHSLSTSWWHCPAHTGPLLEAVQLARGFHLFFLIRVCSFLFHCEEAFLWALHNMRHWEGLKAHSRCFSVL